MSESDLRLMFGVDNTANTAHAELSLYSTNMFNDVSIGLLAAMQRQPAADQQISGVIMDADGERSLTDHKIAASEARADAKIAGFQGQFDALSLKLDAIGKGISEQRAEGNSNRNMIVSTVVAIGFTLAALLLAVMAYGDSVFSRGMSVRDVVDSVTHEMQKTAQTPKTP